MAERRTRQHDSPRRRKRESTKAVVDQDEVPRTRAPYQPAEISSSYSSSSSSYIDISRTFPPSRPRGLGAIRAFFTSPSEHRRRPRRRTSRPYSHGGSSSSSSINTDLAYGTGYIRRRKGDKRRRKGKEREYSDRRDPRTEKDPDAAILEVGAGLAALARKQNRLDVAEARRQGILPPKRSDSSFLKKLESSRGLGSSKVSHGPDEEGWESATDADSETSSVDSRLAYGHYNGPRGGFFRNRPKRKDSVVDPALFGPANSLHGIVHERVGFDDVDYDNLSDCPPPTVAALQRQRSYPPPPTIAALQGDHNYPPRVPPLQREQSVASGSASASGPMKYVYPVPTSDPTEVEARSSVVSAQDPYGPRPVPIQQASVPIQQPQPKPVVSQSVFEPPYSTKSEPKVPSSSGRTKSSVAGAALAGVAGAAIVGAMSSDRQDERKNRERPEDTRDPYDGDRRAERRKDEPRERPDMKGDAGDRREKRRKRDRDRPEESREERRERRRREKRDDPDYERREDDIPDDGTDRRREDKYSERTDDRDDIRRTREDAPVVPPVDPFQYQVADDAFQTPDGTRNSEPFTSIERARSPAIVVVDRVPHWHPDASIKKETVEPVDNAEGEKDWEARDRQQTEREAESLYEEIEHSTIPVEASAVSAAIAAEENRHSREKVRKRRYDRSGDASPTGERDPIQEEADRIYREAVLARKISESKHDDPVTRVVTPPEMAHKKEKEVLYPVPNADFELDHVMDPVEFMTSPIKGPGESFDRIKSISGVAVEDLRRPLLTLIRPTPTPSPAPEEQNSRSKRGDSSREIDSSESKSSETERKESSRDPEPSEAQKKPAVDTVITEAKGDATQTPTSANGTKGVTWGENDTKHYEVESPYETKDDPIASSVKASEIQEMPKMSKERKASAWGALRGAFMGGAAAEVVAKATEASKDQREPHPDRRENDVQSDTTEKYVKSDRKDNSRTEPFEYRGVVVEPEHSDEEVRERDPPAVGPKPSKMPGSNMPGAFEDDLEFTATLAAGLKDSGFDPNIVIDDPTYRRRSSPPGSEDPPLAGYKQPYAETVSDLSQYTAPSTDRSRDIKAQDNDDYAKDRTDREQRKLDKAAKRQSSEPRDLDLLEKTSVAGQLVEEPESFLESSKSSKKEKKRDKSKKSKDSYDEVDDHSNKRVSVPVDDFDDLRTEAVNVEDPADWETPKKSKRKSKRDSDQYDSPSRSMSASDMTSSVEQPKKKSKDKSSRRSSQYDSEPNPEDVPLPSASEVSRDDDYDSRKSKRSSKSSSISDVADRDARPVKSDSSRYADEDDSRSSKKEKKNSGFFGGIFGSSTSKSEPERSRDAEESESKKKKSKRSSTGDGSEIYGNDAKSDVKTSPNGNGYRNYNDDDGGAKRSMNGDSKHGKTDGKEESFLGNAGTLGAGVGLAAAIALAAQHQQSKAATAEIEERVSRRSTSEHASPAEAPAVEASREAFEEDIVDPEIVQRQFRPSIDPQYGDLLPLPPSNPGSPNTEPDDALPSLPETPPGTPPKIENNPPRDRSVGSSRRNELPALVKTPSHSAIPIQYIMGNRSTPSSPGIVRAPPTASPSTMSPDTHSFHRSRPRPTSWDSTKEIKPLYLLDPSRRAPTSQSTDSEVQSPVAEDAAKSTQIESLMHVSEAAQDTTFSDARDFAEETQLESREIHLHSGQIPKNTSTPEFPDPTTLPPLPKSQTTTPMGRGVHDSDLSSLPPLPKSGTSTPADSSDLSKLPQLPDSRSSTVIEDRSLHSSDLAATGLLTGATLGLSAAALASASRHDESGELKELAPKSTSIEELPAEFQVEPITKDRSSYLFQATPPAKGTKDVDIESPLEKRQAYVSGLPQTVEEGSAAEDVTSGYNDSPIRVRSVERDAALEALIRSVPVEKEQEPSETIAHVQSAAVDEVEVNTPDEFSFTKPKKGKKKDKKKQVDLFGIEDEPSSSTVTPPSMADSGKDIEGPPEFSLKKSKKDKKKDKKRGSSQWNAGDEPSENVLLAPTIETATLDRDIVDEPFSSVTVPSEVEPPPDNAETVEEFPLKKSKKDKRRDKKRGSTQMDVEDEPSERIVLVPSTKVATQDRDVVDEPPQPVSIDALPSSMQPAPQDSETGEEYSFKKSKKDKKMDKKKGFDLSEPRSGDSSSNAFSQSIASAVKEADIVDEPSEPFTGTALPSSVEPTEDIDTTEEFSLKKSKDKKRDRGKTLDLDNASLNTVMMPSEPSTLREVDTFDGPSEPLSEIPLPSSIKLVDDADTQEEFSPKKSKKDKKKDKKKALDWTEGGDEVSPITVLPTSVASAAQEADPSDEYSSTPSKKDKKKDKKNRKSLSRSSTLVEQGVDESSQVVDAKDEDLSKAEQTPLPVSRAISEIGAGSELGDIDTGIRDILPSQKESLQSAEPFIEPASAKESTKSKKKGRKSSLLWELDEPSASEAMANEPLAEPNTKPIEREEEAFDSKSKDITAIQDEPQSEPQADIIPATESELAAEDPFINPQADIVDTKESRLAAEEPLTEPQADISLNGESKLAAEQPLIDEPVQDESVKGEQGQKEAEPDRKLPSLDKPIERNAVREVSMPDEPIKELANRELGVEDSRREDTTAAEDDDQGKPVELLSESNNAKNQKKSKKKKGKSFQAWQDDEAPESQPTIDPVSEPTTAAPSELEDLSGVSTPTSKSKGKKRQKRKSIAWDIQEPEPEPSMETARSTATSNLVTRDASEETKQSKEVVELPRHELGEAVTVSQNHGTKEEIDHVQESTPRDEVTPYESAVATKEIEESLARIGPNAMSATFTESEPFSTARSDFSGVEYFPSAASLHSPQVLKDLGESIKTGYFPSAVLLLPVAAPILAVAASSKAQEMEPNEHPHPEDAPLSITTVKETVAEPPRALGEDVRHEHLPVDKPSSPSREMSSADAQPPSPVSMHPPPEPITTNDVPKQIHMDYFPSAAFLHSPSSAGSNESVGGTGYYPSATTLLPLVGAAAILTGEHYREQEPLAKEVEDDREPPLSRALEYDEQPPPAADHQAAETMNLVTDGGVLEPKSQVPDEQGEDSKSSALYSEEQLEAARQLNAEFGSGKKKSKKNKKGRADLSRTSTQNDDFPTQVANELEEAPEQTGFNREVQAAKEPPTADGLAAGYKEDQVALAKKLQAEFDSGAKKLKKGKKSRSTSRTPRDNEPGSPFFEDPQAVEESEAADTQPAEELSREIIPEDQEAPRKQGPDGLAAGFTQEQLEMARQMREDFASGSKKSKKDKKRKSLIRSATDENVSGPIAEGGSEETSLTNTEVDSATDSPYPLFTVPMPDDFESSFTTKGKKGKKRQSLLRSFTQDSEDSAGPSREIVAEPEPMPLETSGNDIVKAADIAPITYPEDEPSSAVAEEPESFSFSAKKGKKGNKKRQSLLRTATQEEEPSSDPTSLVIEPESTRKEISGASTSQPLEVVADDDIAALGEELNFSLKKSKKGKKGKDVSEVLAGTEDVSQPAEQGIVTERDIASKNDREEGSLADRIWAGIVPNESIQSEIENPSAESEDPLGLFTTKKSKKNKKKGQAKSTLASEFEPLPADRDIKDPGTPMDGESKEPPLPWADGVAEGKVENKQPKLFDTWSFGNLPLDKTAQETFAHEPQTTSKDFEVVPDMTQEEPVDRSHASLPTEDDRLQEFAVQERENLEPVNVVETPPPAMPKALAWEDEPAQEEQQPEGEEVDVTRLSAPRTEGHDAPDAKGKAKQGAANPVSAGILAAGGALLAGAAMGHEKEPTEAEPLFTGVPRSTTEKNEPSTLKRVESEKKREKRPAKLLDRRSLPKDNLFDDPMLWEGPEAQKFGDHMIDDEARGDTGFWSAAVDEEKAKDDFAVDDVEEGPSSMPHKRERSESLQDVREPSTVLDHIKTPRKHQHEDVPAAMARDAIMEQEVAEEQPVRAESLNRDIPEEDPLRIDNLEPVSQWNDDPEDLLIQSSMEALKNKKQSDLEAWDAPVKDKKTDIGPSYTTTIDPSISREIDATPIEDQRTSVVSEASKDLGHYREQESRSSPSSVLPFVGEPESHVQRVLHEETFQPSKGGHEESAKDIHRHQEIYLPPSSTTPQAIKDESVLRRELDFAPSEPPNEGRTKDKHRRQESYFAPPSTLPVVIEEEYHKPESEHIAHEHGINDNNRDSAFVTESPVPFQRRIPEDHEYARDSGVHLRDWGDTPVSKEKPHVASADDALARLSWPAVDEETETVDLKRSQRPKDERSPRGHAPNPALGAGAGAVAVAELSHLAARSPPQNKYEHGNNAKVDRSITPNMSRLQTPDHSKYRPGSVGSNRSSGTPPLRRSDRKLSGDLRSLSQRSQANLAKEAKDAKEAERSPATSIVNINPIANEGRPRVKDMADVYVSHQQASSKLRSILMGTQDGYGEGRIGSPMSPTRPHSMRRRQSLQVLDLEARVEQLAAENRMLAEAKELAERSLQSSQRATLALADRDTEVDNLKQTLDWLQREVERLKEVNDGLASANITLGRQHNERYGTLESQHADATRELEDLRQKHRGLSGGIGDMVMERVATATEEKDREIAQLRQDLEAAHDRIREMQREILTAKGNDSEFLVFRDEDYFDNACQQLCQHVQQWVLRFSKFSDMRACRRTNEINNDKIIDRLDNAVLDGSDVDEYLSDRVKRRDIFMSMTMTMIWEFVFTRYLFGMDREQRQKLKSLEKILLEVGPPAAVHQWRATTLTLLSKREAFQQQREQDTVAVAQVIFQTLSEILPPPTHLEEQIQEQLMRVMKAAVDLSIEMRTQRAEYMMLPPLQPEYDANGDLARQVQFNAALMNERSGDTVSNEELEAQHAVVRIVLFPLVVKKGDDTGGGDEEIVVCPAQVLVAKPKRHTRGLTPEGLGQNPNHSRVSMQSSMPVDQRVPDI
jgi:hypothetical protein